VENEGTGKCDENGVFTRKGTARPRISRRKKVLRLKGEVNSVTKVTPEGSFHKDRLKPRERVGEDRGVSPNEVQMRNPDAWV